MKNLQIAQPQAPSSTCVSYGWQRLPATGVRSSSHVSITRRVYLTCSVAR